MKIKLHPDSHPVNFICHCGQIYRIRSTLKSSTQNIDVCGNCHPFQSGKQLTRSNQNQINKFHQRYNPKDTLAPSRSSFPGQQIRPEYNPGEKHGFGCEK